jgi:hypothetical protein
LRDILNKWGWESAKALAILAVLFAAFFLGQSARISSQCISSRTFTRVEYFSRSLEIPRCDQLLPMDSNSEFPAAQVTVIRRALARVDRLAQIWNLPSLGLQLTIVEEEPFLFQLSERQLFLGSSYLGSSDLLLRALVEGWVEAQFGWLNYNDRKITARFFTAISMGEYLNWSYLGEANHFDPIQGLEVVAPNQSDCLSPIRNLQSVENCAVSSLRPELESLYAFSLWQIHQLATWQERRLFWAWLKGALQPGEAGLLLSESGAPSEIAQNLNVWLAGIFTQPARQSQILRSLNRQLNFDRVLRPVTLLEGEGLSSTVLAEAGAVVYDRNAYWWWGTQGLMKAPTPSSAPKHHVIVGCTQPTIT